MSFRTDVATMTGAATNVDQVNASIQGELSRLQGIVAETSGVWRGQAQGAFQNLMERWNTSARELSEALNSISENIRANARSFDDTELENMQAFR